MDGPATPAASTTMPQDASRVQGTLRYVRAVNGARLDRTAKHVLLAMLEWVDFDTWTTWVGTTAIAEATGLHYDTVQQTRAKLTAAGIFKTIRPASGRRAPTVQIDLEALTAQAVGGVALGVYETDEPVRGGTTPPQAKSVGGVPDRPYAVGGVEGVRRGGPTQTKHQNQNQEEEVCAEAKKPSPPPTTEHPNKPTPPTPTYALAIDAIEELWAKPIGAAHRRWLLDDAAMLAARLDAIPGVTPRQALDAAVAAARASKPGWNFHTPRNLARYLGVILENFAEHGLPEGAHDGDTEPNVARYSRRIGPPVPRTTPRTAGHQDAGGQERRGDDPRGAALTIGGTRRPARLLVPKAPPTPAPQ